MSNVIKARNYVTLEGEPKIEIRPPVISPNLKKTASTEDAQAEEQVNIELQEALSLKEQILSDAEHMAEQLLEKARQDAEVLKAQAQVEIDQWWEAQRREDDGARRAAEEAGYSDGYRNGVEQAENDVMEQYREQLGQASRIVEQAVLEKLRIVSEAEPFLIELSCGIAEKIIRDELRNRPQWLTAHIRDLLLEKKDGGVITLCVSPDQYSFVMNARDELKMAVDASSELQIVADATVNENGVIIRSSFGSMDARIDTQLAEIKKVLLSVAESKGDSQEHGNA